MDPTPSPITPPRRNWWQRNWKWFVPTGCLTLIALAVAFVAMIVVVVFGAMKSSDAYRIAASRARNDERVVRAIGKPVTEGWFVSGSTKVVGGSGQADLEIPISGPKGKAKIYVVATKSAGEWVYSKLVVRVESTGETIDLNEDAR
jgi:hypothetical protein